MPLWTTTKRHVLLSHPKTFLKYVEIEDILPLSPRKYSQGYLAYNFISLSTLENKLIMNNTIIMK